MARADDEVIREVRTLQLYAVVVHNINDESVDYSARWHVVARNVNDALKKIRAKIERGEVVMDVHRITAVDVQ